MFLAGIKEEADRGVWLVILEMNRKEVVKKYIQRKTCFIDYKEQRLSELIPDLSRNSDFHMRKKQFSQSGRPPRYRLVLPRIIFSPDKDNLNLKEINSLLDLKVPEFYLCMDKGVKSDLKADIEVDEAMLLSLLDKLEKEDRFKGEPVKEKNPRLDSALALALWGGEKIWRMVRYGA